MLHTRKVYICPCGNDYHRGDPATCEKLYGTDPAGRGSRYGDEAVLKVVVIRKQTDLGPAMRELECDESGTEKQTNNELMIPNPFEERNWPPGWRYDI